MKIQTKPRPFPSRWLAVALAALAPGTAGSAQCNPPTIPNPLQQAIDAALPGDVIVIGPAGPSNQGQRVWIDKPLTLLGTPGAAPIQFQVFGFAVENCESGAITIGPAVAGSVTLQGLEIEGVSLGNPGCLPGGIRSCSPSATVVVSACTVRGASYIPSGGDGGSGEAGILGTFGLLVVLDSTIEGGNGEPIISTGPGGDGAPAVDIAGEALLVRSQLIGGDGGPTHGHPPGAPPALCAQLYQPATAGDAVVASKVTSWGSVGVGGHPGVWLDCVGDLIGYGQPGAPLAAGPMARFSGDAAVAVGATLTLELLGGGTGTLYMGPHGWSTSIDVPPFGTVFLGASPALVFQGSWPDQGLQLPIPALGTLVGVQAVFQVLRSTPFSPPQLTNPLQVVLTP